MSVRGAHCHCPKLQAERRALWIEGERRVVGYICMFMCNVRAMEQKKGECVCTVKVQD